MSLNSILGAATSGLMVSQTGLKTVSDNIANINTPGYVRRVVDQQARSLSELGGGVEVVGIRRVVDQFLRQASLSASADAGAAAALSELLDRAQGLFGDPSAESGFFNQLDKVWQSFSSAALEPTSSVARNAAVSSINEFLDRAGSLAGGVESLLNEATGRIRSGIDKANRLLVKIDELNASITRSTAMGQDASGAQNAQGQLINQLSQLLDISVGDGGNGRTIIRAGPAGSVLVGEQGAATLAYDKSGGAPGALTVQMGGTSPNPLAIGGGELSGLLELVNSELPNLGLELSEYVTRAVDEINRAHNASSSLPAPSVLSGRNTGLDLPTALAGFTGTTTVAVVDAAGAMQRKVEIDFTAGTMSVNGGAGAAFTPGSFLAQLNAALGGAGAASFTNGALSISAAGGNGVAIADDATTPSTKAGKGFSQFFGLNDLITSTGFPNTATGLDAASAHGFTAGDQITFRISDASGAPLRDVAISVPAGATMGNLVAALNANVGGVGLYGAFSLDSAGRLAFAANATGAQLTVVSDATHRGPSGPSISKLFGLDKTALADRASSFSLRSDVSANSGRLALAQLDPTAAIGATALLSADNRGALALASAGQRSTRFDQAGGLGSLQTTLSQYAAQLSGSIGQRAAAAAERVEGAQAVSAEADARRSSVEGVNLDEELIQLTTYQQSYNASARLIQAVKEMYDVLLQMT